MRILCFDPGITTGYCTADIKEGCLVYTAFQKKFDHLTLWDFIRSYDPNWIVCESFEFRNRIRPGTELFSVELIGIIQLYTKITKCGLSLQTASTAGAGGKKGPFNNQILKDQSLYEPAKPHAMDATRHLLVWWMFGRGFEFNKTKKYVKI